VTAVHTRSPTEAAMTAAAVGCAFHGQECPMTIYLGA